METPSLSGQIRSSNRRAISIIFLIMLMDIIGLTLLNPVSPYIVKRYSEDALMVTMLNVIYAAGQFFAAPLFGKLGDRFGRRPVLILSVIGSAVGYLIFGIGGALWVLFLSRVIDGITGGNLSTAAAYIADVSEPEKRAKNFALIGVAWGLGLILGPAIGGVFSQFSLEAPAYAAAVLSLLNATLAYFLLPESLHKEQRETKPIRLRDINPVASIGDMARKPGLGGILIALGLFNFAFNSITSTQALFAIDKFNATPTEISLLLVLVGIVVAVMQLGLVARVVKRFGEKKAAIGSLVGQGIVNLTIFVSPFLWVMYALSVMANALSAFTFPTLTSLSTNRVPPQEVGTLMGVTTAINSLMSIAGPLWGGLVYDHLMPGAPYWTSLFIFFAGAFVLARMQLKPVQLAAE